MEDDQSGVRWVLWGMGGCLAALSCALAYVTPSAPGAVDAHAPVPVFEDTVTTAPVPVACTKNHDERVFEALWRAENFDGAYQVAKPHLLDTVGSVSKGAMLLAAWLGEHGNWTDIAPGQESPSIKLVKKDPASARGQRTCVRGIILAIGHTFGHTFEGRIFAGGDVVHYFAAGNPGTLVDGNRAKFCGVITGLYAYENVSGGKTQSVQMVGMFDPARQPLGHAARL